MLQGELRRVFERLQEAMVEGWRTTRTTHTQDTAQQQQYKNQHGISALAIIIHSTCHTAALQVLLVPRPRSASSPSDRPTWPPSDQSTWHRTQHFSTEQTTNSTVCTPLHICRSRWLGNSPLGLSRRNVCTHTSLHVCMPA